MHNRLHKLITIQPSAGSAAPPMTGTRAPSPTLAPAYVEPHAEAATEAVFVVGVSRSGTTLMRRILNRSNYVAIASENHFLGHLIASEGMRYKFRRFGKLADDKNVERLVEHLYSDEFMRGSMFRGVSTQWRWIVRRVDREDLLQRILCSDRSERSLFAIMMRVYADAEGKPVMGEKTPAHVRYVPTLLTWFPRGKVIHMLRDPRGIYISELRRRQQQPPSTPYRYLRRVPGLLQLFVLLQISILWSESVRRYRRYAQRYPASYYLLRFEDLVSAPDQQIEAVCRFLQIPFQPEMLEQAVVSKGFQAGEAGFDSAAADRWRCYISPWSKAWFGFWFGRALRELGYAV